MDFVYTKLCDVTRVIDHVMTVRSVIMYVLADVVTTWTYFDVGSTVISCFFSASVKRCKLMQNQRKYKANVDYAY